MLTYKTKPYQHQLDILQQTWNKPYWGLFLEMGVGKSKIVIDTIANLYLTGKIDSVLYVAKKGEFANFPVYEIPVHMPDNVQFVSTTYSGYSTTKQVAAIKVALAPTAKLRIFSMNIESLRAGKGFQIAEAFCKSSKKLMIVVDESTTLKDHRSTQHKAMMKLRGYADYVRIMTGTLIPRSPVDVFNQSRFLNAMAMGVKTLTGFRAIYEEQELVVLGNRRFQKTIGVKNIDKFRRQIRTFATVLRKTDCLDLPEKIYASKVVPLTGEQVKLYQDFVDYSISEIDGEFVEAVNALSVMSKLHQIVCGQIRLPDGTYRPVESNRAKYLADFAEEVLESQKKIVVWSHFREATAGLFLELERRGLKTEWLEAGLSSDERSARIASFKTDKSVKVFLGNPQSSGFGITLTEASTMMYYSNSDNFEHRLQSEDRIHRIGQKETCLYYDFHTPGTVEDAILARTKSKGEVRDQLMPRQDFLKLIALNNPITD
jgi:SNF2 family DNA or RNA helicase